MPDSSTLPPLSAFARRVLVVIGLGLVALLIAYVVYRGANVLLLVFAGILLALLLSGLAEQLSKRTPVPRKVALGLVSLLILGLLVGFGFFAGPQISSQFGELSTTLPESIDQVKQWVRSTVWGDEALEQLQQADDAMSSGSGGLFGRITSLFSNVVGTLIDIVVILFVGVYVAISPKLYRDGALYLVPPAHRDRIRETFRKIGHALQRWLVGRFASMAVVGLLTTLGLWLLGVPLALTLGVLAALLSFVPNLGPALAIVPALLIGLTVSTQTALYVGLLYLGVQFVESYLITPLIQQKAVSVPPALLITVQVLMGILAGVLGLFLATPLLVAVIVLIQMLYLRDVLNEDVPVLGEDTDS